MLQVFMASGLAVCEHSVLLIREIKFCSLEWKMFSLHCSLWAVQTLNICNTECSNGPEKST